MECKCPSWSSLFSVFNELIDTLWNVNKFGTGGENKWSKELIDTLWNVNIISLALLEVAIRINRYIMECKFASS